MSPSPARRKRVTPKRDGPIRNPVVSGPAEAADIPSAADFGEAVGGTVRAAERLAEVSGATVRGAVECGVQTAYTVIDEYMRRGREAAGRQQHRPNGSNDMSDRQYDSYWTAAWGPAGPLVAPWMQMMKVWTDAMTTFVPGAGPAGPQDPFKGHAPPGAAGATNSAPPTGAPKVSVKVSSPNTEVTPCLWRFDDRMTADPLQNSDGSGALPISGVNITCEPGHVHVSVTVMTDQPAGRYTGAIWNATRSEIVGSLTVEIAQVPGSHGGA